MRLQKDVEGIKRWVNSDTLLVLSSLRRTMGMDHDERFIFQGVHMLFEGKFDRACGKEEHRINLVFIGRNFDRDFLNMGFKACLA